MKKKQTKHNMKRTLPPLLKNLFDRAGIKESAQVVVELPPIVGSADITTTPTIVE